MGGCVNRCHTDFIKVNCSENRNQTGILKQNLFCKIIGKIRVQCSDAFPVCLFYVDASVFCHGLPFSMADITIDHHQHHSELFTPEPYRGNSEEKRLLPQ